MRTRLAKFLLELAYKIDPMQRPFLIKQPIQEAGDRAPPDGIYMRVADPPKKRKPKGAKR